MVIQGISIPRIDGLQAGRLISRRLTPRHSPARVFRPSLLVLVLLAEGLRASHGRMSALDCLLGDCFGFRDCFLEHGFPDVKGFCYQSQ